MANQLKMAKVQTIHTLHQQGWSQRRIAKELGIDRATVARYVGTGSGPAAGSAVQNQPQAPPGSEAENQPQAPPGSAASRSTCEPYRTLILAKLEQGLSAQRIYQDLCEEAEVSYYSVRRFVASLKQERPRPFRRLEQPPGEEAQVDFGTGARVVQPDGRRRKTHLFRIVLSHSRKAYSEVVYRQTTENFVRCLENAFWHFGGVPRTLVIDNLRAAVKKVDWFEPELNPKVESFCRHYGTVVLPTRPAMPRHKGKVEKGVDYAQDNALKGRQFESLAQQNQHLLRWETTVADTRIHGTTRKQVGKAFREVERPALQALNPQRFPFFYEGQRKTHRDGHVEVDKAYYSVPPEYVGRTVWARWDGRLVRLFNHRWEQIAVHAKGEPGSFNTNPAHLSDKKIATVERGAVWLLNRASAVGPHTEAWASHMMADRGVQGLRTLQGLLALTDKHSYRDIEKACEIAHSYGAYRLANVRKLIANNAAKQEHFEFMQEHAVIRDISVYGDLVRTAIERQKTLYRRQE
jgi:transposase